MIMWIMISCQRKIQQALNNWEEWCVLILETCLDFVHVQEVITFGIPGCCSPLLNWAPIPQLYAIWITIHVLHFV